MSKSFIFFIISMSLIFFIIFLLPECQYYSSKNNSRNKINSAENIIYLYHLSISMYFKDNRMYPTSEQGLNALYVKPRIPPIPQNYPVNSYLKEQISFIDPWGNPYQYTYQLLDGKHKVTILSFGADGKIGGKGYDADIVSIIETEAN